jgi:arylsulfatase A-like enzyme
METAPPRNRPGLHLRLAPLVVFAVLVAAGCGHDTREPVSLLPDLAARHVVAALYDRFDSDNAIVAAPGRHVAVMWTDGGKLGIRKTAAVVFDVSQPVDGDLIIELDVDPWDVRRVVQVRWDHVRLEPWRVGLEATTLETRIEGRYLTPGRHALTLNVGLDGDEVADADSAVLVVPRVRCRLDDGTDSAPVPFLLDTYLGSFLDLGVAGPVDQQLGGLLVQGSRTVETPLPIDRSAELVFNLWNQSRSPVRFTAEIGSTSVSVDALPGANTGLRVPVAAGDQILRLTTEGESSGMYLWGAPRLVERSDRVPPTILVVTLDTVRRDAIFDREIEGVTPHLDDLCSQSTVYDQALSTAPWTLPSHASIFTGLFPSHHGAGTTSVRLGRNVQTLAGMLRDTGYLTAGLAGGMMASSRFGLARGFSFYGDPIGSERPGREMTPWVQTILEAAEDTPLFLFINYFDAHGPYHALKPFRERLEVDRRAAALPPGPGRGFASGDFGLLHQATLRMEVLSADELDVLQRSYLAEVAAVDAEFGILLDGLRARGRFDDSLIIVLADHGEHFGERGRFDHSYSLDPELIHIPLIVKRPGQERPGRVATPVSQVDVLPTVAGIVGIKGPEVDGRPLPRSDVDGVRDGPPLIVEEHAMVVHQRPSWAALGDHTYGISDGGLYAVLGADDLECRDVGDGSWRFADCPVGRDQITTEIERVIGELWWQEDTSSPADLSAEDVRALRELGYLE